MLNSEKLTAKEIYIMLITMISCKPSIQIYLDNLFKNFKLTLNQIMVTVDSYLLCFQHKIMNNILFFNKHFFFLENFLSCYVLSIEITTKQCFRFFTNATKCNVYGFNRKNFLEEVFLF